MKLYFSPGACSLSPHIVLNEAGLPYERERTDGKTKITESGRDFKQVNPLGYVPVLELDDGTKLTEGPAIVQYIADKAPGKKLAPPAGTMERTRLQSWLNFVSSELHKGFSPLFNGKMPQEAKEIFAARLKDKYAYVDTRLEGKDYLMGAQFSVADAYLFTVTNWAAGVGIDLTGFKNLAAFNARMKTRPAVQDAMKAEGLLK
jgi:glutathione S-transferase